MQSAFTCQLLLLPLVIPRGTIMLPVSLLHAHMTGTTEKLYVNLRLA